MNTLEIAAVGLRQDLERLKLTSQNVANLSTPGYKRQVAVQRPFAETLALTADLAVSTDTRAGKFNATGQPFDIALPDGRFLLLELADGSQALSRQGALQLDASGELRSLAGHKVLGTHGAIGLRADQRTGVEIDGQGSSCRARCWRRCASSASSPARRCRRWATGSTPRMPPSGTPKRRRPPCARVIWSNPTSCPAKRWST
jgi:flagellar hook-basal body protein